MIPSPKTTGVVDGLIIAINNYAHLHINGRAKPRLQHTRIPVRYSGVSLQSSIRPNSESPRAVPTGHIITIDYNSGVHGGLSLCGFSKSGC